MLDDHAHDLPLARLLNQDGRLPMASIQGLLAEVRAQGPGGPTLARALVARGLLPAADVQALLAGLGGAAAGGAPGLPAALEQVGDYRLVRQLGAGGMGAVFLAEHAATGAEYAVKLATTPHHDPQLRARLQREGEAQARVDAHPNVVRVFAAGEEQGRSYLVMERVQGGTLQELLTTRGPLGVDAAELVAQLADGLHHVHQQGVLHRDLKPHNVLFDTTQPGPPPGWGVPKLVDFGLARLADAQSLTQSGAVLGTPAYMSPEQARGKHRELDARSDVYGLGAVLFACLTGRPPFEQGPLAAVLAQVLRAEPPFPRDLNPEVPEWLEAVCLRALEKDPAKRYADASAFAAALRAPPPAEEPAVRAARGRGGGLAIALIALAVGAGAGALAVRPKAPSPALPAPEPSATAPAEPARVDPLEAALAAAEQAEAVDVAELLAAVEAAQRRGPLKEAALERLEQVALGAREAAPRLLAAVAELRPEQLRVQAAALRRAARLDLPAAPEARAALLGPFIPAAERAVRLARTAGEAQAFALALARCDLLLALGRGEEALAETDLLLCDPAAESGPLRGAVVLRRGRSRWEAFQVAEALEEFDMAYGLGAQEAAGWRALALEAQGLRTQAAGWARRGLAALDPVQRPDQGPLFRRLVLLIYWLGALSNNTAARREAAVRAVEVYPGGAFVGWRARLAYLHLRMNERAEATAALRAAVPLLREDPALSDLVPQAERALVGIARGQGLRASRGLATELDRRAGRGRSFTP